MIELATGVQNGHDYLQGGAVELRMIVYGNSATIICNGDAAVRMKEMKENPQAAKSWDLTATQ